MATLLTFGLIALPIALAGMAVGHRRLLKQVRDKARLDGALHGYERRMRGDCWSSVADHIKHANERDEEL